MVVESVDGAGRAPESVSARRVGQRVLELYWRQARPYPGVRRQTGEAAFLSHSTQASDLVRRITNFRQTEGLHDVSIERARVLASDALAALEE